MLKQAQLPWLVLARISMPQFYITLRDDLDYLDGKHTVFGEIAEGLETLTRINEAYVDENRRPYKNIRIKHTYILDDPFDDPPQLSELIPGASPEGKPKDEVDDNVRLEDDWVPMDEQLAPGELEERLRAKDACSSQSSAVVLETIGDIPDVEIKPPDNVLFVCKLNPVTEDEDLFTIFSRFGTVKAADIIRDFKTGDSLCYAFIEFETKEACEQAYFKMDNALIDDRRIHVDFSQSVARLWSQYRRKDGGKGCFKCGALDHIAKDCTSDSANKQQPQMYILKNDNAHRGGGNNSSYEMVFPEDAPESPRPKKRHQGHSPDDIVDNQKMNRQSSEEGRQNRDHHSLRDRGYKEQSSRDGRSSRSGGRSHRDDLERGRDIEKPKVRQRDTDDDTYVERSREGGQQKRSADGDRERHKDEPRDRDDDDYYSRNRSRDDEKTAERRRDRDQANRTADSDRVKHKDRQRDKDDDRTKERSIDREYRRSAANGSPSDKRCSIQKMSKEISVQLCIKRTCKRLQQCS